MIDTRQAQQASNAELRAAQNALTTEIALLADSLTDSEDVCLTITGEMVEVGQLDDGDHGLVIQCDDGSFVTIKGLSVDDTRDAAPLMFKRVVMTLAEVEVVT